MVGAVMPLRQTVPDGMKTDEVAPGGFESARGLGQRPATLPPSSAPTATGWSDSCRAGFAPAEEWRLVTAH